LASFVGCHTTVKLLPYYISVCMCVDAGYDVLGGEETCAQGSGGSERPSKVPQPYKDH